MLTNQIDTLNTALQWLRDNHSVMLYTVANTWGSSPRPRGSMLAIRDDGLLSGSVSGGCIEDQLIANIGKDVKSTTAPQLAKFGVSGEQANRFGLPCGGELQVIVELLTKATQLEELVSALLDGQLVKRVVDLTHATVTIERVNDHTPATFADNQFSLTLGPGYRLLIIGAVEIAKVLAPIATALNFAVSVCDPRKQYQQSWSLPNIPLLTQMPDDAVIEFACDPCTAIVALTHDAKLDDMALLEALISPAYYVAALGSKNNNNKRRQRLREFALSPEQIASLHGPAGLNIGSRSAAEIAVAIAAEMVAQKSQLTQASRRAD